MGSSSSKKEEKISQDEPSTSTETRGVSKRIYHKLMMTQEKPEEILIDRLVNRIPDLLVKVNEDTFRYVELLKDTWLTERTELVDLLENLDKYINDYMTVAEFKKTVIRFNVVMKALLLLFMVFHIGMFLPFLVFLSLVADGGVFFFYDKSKKNKEKIRELIPAFHHDLSNNERLKTRWLKARQSFKALQHEISVFVFTLRKNKYKCDNIDVKRFMNNSMARDVNSERDFATFFSKDFFELISSYNSSLKFCKASKDDAFHSYMDRCHAMSNAIAQFVSDIGIHFGDVELKDFNHLKMKILSEDAENIGEKVTDLLGVVRKEMNEMNENTAQAQVNLKKRK